MATTFIDPTETQSTEIGAPLPLQDPKSLFEVELSGGAMRQFQSELEVREAILCGDVPRKSLIRKVGASLGDKPTTVEDWAKLNPKLRAIYAPVWGLTMKGAFVGLLVVGALKALDTFVGFFAINPGAALAWLLLGAGLISPKWKLQFIAATLYFSFQIGISLSLLWGAWAGVSVFAAMFGISAGMAIGTIVGFLRLDRLPKAPDAESEGRKPLVLGFAIPAMAFVVAAAVYVQFLMPAALKLLSQR